MGIISGKIIILTPLNNFLLMQIEKHGLVVIRVTSLPNLANPSANQPTSNQGSAQTTSMYFPANSYSTYYTQQRILTSFIGRQRVMQNTWHLETSTKNYPD